MDSFHPTVGYHTSVRTTRKNGFFGTLFFKLYGLLKEPLVISLQSTGGKQPRKGFIVNGKKFVHYTDLHFHETALFNLTTGQKLFLLAFAAIFGVAFLINWHVLLEVIIVFVTMVYFFDALFNLFLVYRSFTSHTQLTASAGEIAALRQEDLPLYTIFCPLYKESEVVPQFVSAMKRMKYPAEKLQILLLLEEDDKETVGKIKNMRLPENFETIVVPHSLPKTKPKAMNYGMYFARGEYVVIFDAEDMPDPWQLQKAVLAFRKAPPETICVQAKLNFYNSGQNVLTKIFTAEYSLWFDLVLPGLQSLRAPIPLGGTSNHFRTADLRKLKGWDAFNVTEDCDLGIRLAKKGYKTAMFNSTTLEEANSGYMNWYGQRSRWIKGYMQTFLVHMRHWRMFTKNGRFHDLLFFQLTVGGKVSSIFLNPFMWLLTIVYFVFRSSLGPAIERYFPSPVLYMGVLAFVFGNFLYLYHYMIGCAKRGFDGLIKYTFLVPFYWLSMSLAAWKALFEIFFKPHYWSKTAHGLHLKTETKPTTPLDGGEIPKAGVSEHLQRPADGSEVTVESKATWYQQLKLNKVLSGAGLLVVASMAASILNFAYNAFLARKLPVEEFGLLALFNTFAYFIVILAAPLGASINYKTSYIAARDGELASQVFFNRTLKNCLLLSTGCFVLWLALTPLFSNFFHISSVVLLAGFAFFPTFFILSTVSSGFLQGNLSFGLVASMAFLEPAVKLFSAALLVVLGFSLWVPLSLPLSVLASAALGLWLILGVSTRAQDAEKKEVSTVSTKHFPKNFYWASLLTGIATAAFLSLDVILAKHYLPPDQAGQYGLLSLVGKMIFFFGSLLSPFIITFVRRDEAQGKNPHVAFHRLLAATTALSALVFAAVGLFGKISVPLLLGPKSFAIVPYLFGYGLSIALFTLTTTLVGYHLVRHQYRFAVVSVCITIALASGIIVFHTTISQIVQILLNVSVVSFAVVAVLHMLEQHGRFLFRNVVDFLDVLLPPPRPVSATGQRILMFNWRDTKHSFAGGAEVYIHELGKRWVSAGHQVTLFCGNDGNAPRNEVVDGVQVIRRGGFYFVYVWAFVYYMLQFRSRYDIIIDCQNGLPFFTPLYAKEKVYCLMHHVHQEVFYRYLSRPLAFLAGFLEKRVMPWVYKHTQFITISPSSKLAMQNLGLGGAGIEIITPGVDLENLQPGEKYQRPLILYLGRLKAYKSVDVLIRAFQNIVRRLPNSKLVIAGSGEEEENLKKLTAKLNLEKQVVFTGKVTEQEKLSLLQKAWVLVNPSLMEGWGITTIEANACGVPVVAADVPGLRDSVKNPHTGYLVPYGDHEKFTQKILDILINKNVSEYMSTNALQWASKFNWNDASQKFIEAINKIKVVGGKLSPRRGDLGARTVAVKSS